MITPDLHDRLTALWRRFDSFPEARYVEGGAVLKTDAYLAFLEARKLIDRARAEFYEAVKRWRPIETFFEAEHETPVLLWAERPEAGELAVMLGYWDDDAQAWYRDGQGAGDGDPVIVPTMWLALTDATLLAGEYVAVARMD